MLSRQRNLLSLVERAGGRATHLELTKWAFLLRAETPSGGGSAFYGFLPYKYGPFSFCLYHEASALIRDGYMSAVDDRTWQIEPPARGLVDQLPTPIRDDIDSVLGSVGGKTSNELIEYVYSRHPSFTVNSRTSPRSPRPIAKLAAYTAGYEGLSVDSFLNGLVQTGIRLLIDVRNNPIARRYGFHRGTLQRLCSSIGIEYCHFPELGIESQHRRCLKSDADRSKLFNWYEQTILAKRMDSIEKIIALLRSAPGVLVCMEAYHAHCHRNKLACHVAARSGLSIQHLELNDGCVF